MIGSVEGRGIGAVITRVFAAAGATVIASDVLEKELAATVQAVGPRARARHLDALRRARTHVEEAHRLLTERHAGELVAQELTDAQKQLGEITGQVTSDDLLGRIFASFCIGK